MTIRTIIVDDEKLAIQGLMLRLEKFPDVDVIETCANGREAIRRIKTEKPDLVFLDIQMPGFDGFSVISIKTIENQIGKALRIMRTELSDYLPVMLIFILFSD